MNNHPETSFNIESLVTLLTRGVTALETLALVQGRKDRTTQTGLRARQRKSYSNSIPLAGQQPKTKIDEEMAQVLRNYILDHPGRFTTTEYIERENPKIVGAIDAPSCAGRFQRDKDGRSCLAVTRYWFVAYAAKCGIDKRRVKSWLKQNGIMLASGRLTPRGSTHWCYVIPEIKFKESSQLSVM